MRLVVPFAVLALLVALVLHLDGGMRRSDLVVVHRADVFTLDPFRMSYQQDLRVGQALYEGLVVLDPFECRPMPATAERWERSEDGREYRFMIRSSARWSNGDPVTSHDFAEGWMRALLPDLAADYTGLLFAIDGAEEFFRWRVAQLAEFAARPATERTAERAEAMRSELLTRFATTVGVSTPDPQTLVVRLRRPTAYFLDLLAMGIYSPVHRPTIAKFTTLDAGSGAIRVDHGWTRPGVLVSNGPYQLDGWRYKRDLRLRRNPHYWNESSIHAETITVLPLEDNNTAVLAFDSSGSAGAGGIDWIADVTVEYRADLLAQRRTYEDRYASEIAAMRAADPERDPDDILAALPPPERSRGERRTIHAFDAFGTDFFSFNCRPTLVDGRPNPFADPRVRRAFVRAVDRDLIVEKVTRLHERTSGSLTPAGSIPGYTAPTGITFDPARAAAELAEAGWSDRDGDGLVEDESGRVFPTIDLLYSSGNPRFEDLSLALRDMWQRALSVPIEVRSNDAKFYKDDLKSGNFMIARGGWYGDFGDPMAYLMLSRTGDGNNDRGYSNPAFDAMLDEAEAEVDPAQRLALLAEAERFLMEEESPFIPLCTYKTLYMYEPGVLKGLTRHPRLEQYFGRLRRAEAE